MENVQTLILTNVEFNQKYSIPRGVMIENLKRKPLWSIYLNFDCELVKIVWKPHFVQLKHTQKIWN